MDVRYKERFNFGLLVATPDVWQKSKNIGDYIQSLASAQFYPRIDEYIHRETISDYDSKDSTRVKCIMNAWWMWSPEKWPPSKDILPLPISMHISPLHSDEMLSGKGLEWFVKNQPIGCRDMNTMELLQGKGIDAYFSGCLTLTLGKTYQNNNSEQSENIIYFVDPYYKRDSSKKRFVNYLYLLKAPFTILKMNTNEYFSFMNYNSSRKRRNWLKKLLFTCEFYCVFSKLFSNFVLRNAKYIHHILEVKNESDEEFLAMADRLLVKYSNSRLVVTSRIHAALPCLGMNTPVIFVNHKDIEGDNYNGNRLKGLINLFRVIKINRNQVETNDKDILTLRKIKKDTIISNKSDWKNMAIKLNKLVESFVHE